MVHITFAGTEKAI